MKIHGDGNQTRVFCHVSDAVNAICMLMESESTAGEVFNIGGVGEISIQSLAQRIINLCESKSSISYLSYEDAYGRGFEDMARRVPDISKIKEHTGWEPKRNIDDVILDVKNSLIAR